MKIIRLNEVLNRCGLSRTTLYEYMRIGEFPRQVALGARAVGWLESDVDGWIKSKLGNY